MMDLFTIGIMGLVKEAVRMSEMKYQKEFEEFVRKNPEFLGGNTLTVQRENYGASLDTPEYAASYVRFSYEMFCKIKEQLEQELQKTREQLSKAEQRIFHLGECSSLWEYQGICDCGYEQYFKDKQGVKND